MTVCQPGDLILISHRNSPSASCLVLDVKKVFNYYEIKLMNRGKVFTIIEDGGGFYTIKVLSKNEKKDGE